MIQPSDLRIGIFYVQPQTHTYERTFYSVYRLGIFTYNTSHGHFWINNGHGYFNEPIYLHLIVLMIISCIKLYNSRPRSKIDNIISIILIFQAIVYIYMLIMHIK